MDLVVSARRSRERVAWSCGLKKAVQLTKPGGRAWTEGDIRARMECARLGHRVQPLSGGFLCQRTVPSETSQAASLRYGRQNVCATDRGSSLAAPYDCRIAVRCCPNRTLLWPRTATLLREALHLKPLLTRLLCQADTRQGVLFFKRKGFKVPLHSYLRMSARGCRHEQETDKRKDSARTI
jgi:hypothetical protein